MSSTNKLLGAGVAGALTVIVVWGVQTFGHVTIPAEVASAFTTLLAAAGTYVAPANT